QRTTLAFLACLAFVAPGRAQAPALDLIPSDSPLALVVKNLDDLKEKGEQFFKDHNVDADKAPRPSQLFDRLFDLLKLKEGVDRKGSAAFLLPSLQKLGLKKLDFNDSNTLLNAAMHLVLVVPISDADAVGKNFGLKKGELKPGKTIKSNMS